LTPRNKKKLTETLIQSTDISVSVDQALLTWYYNIRSSGGMRLTETGYQAFSIMELQQWGVGIKEPNTTFTKQVLLMLDRKLQYPYYIDYKNKSLVFFGSKEAMMATLYKDLVQFLDNYY
jgi:hypothetical protein